MSLGSEIRAAKAKAVGGKKDRCRKGKSCSATCISGFKACLVEMSDQVSSSLGKLKTKLSPAIAKAKEFLPEKSKERLKGQQGKYLRIRKELVSRLNKARFENSDKSGLIANRIRDLDRKFGRKLRIKISRKVSLYR